MFGIQDVHISVILFNNDSNSSSKNGNFSISDFFKVQHTSWLNVSLKASLDGVWGVCVWGGGGGLISILITSSFPIITVVSHNNV